MPRHILTIDEIDRETIEALCERAVFFEEELRSAGGRRRLQASHPERIAMQVFFEPSTRTDLSFWAAATRLGMHARTVQDARTFSSFSKGESPRHAGRVISGYADVIIVRHDETGGVAKIAERSIVPVINAGDGRGEHPTQTLLDLFMIWKKFGRLDNIHIMMCGDLLRGRTVHSLAIALTKFEDIDLTFIAPPHLQMDEGTKLRLKEAEVPFTETGSIGEALEEHFHVLYETRAQTERAGDEEEGAEGFDPRDFTITTEHMSRFPQNAILMHPLPIAGEVDPEVDDHPQAAYFEQSDSGVPMRMAILEHVLQV